MVGKGQVDGNGGQLPSCVVERAVEAQVGLHERHIEGDSDTGRIAGTASTGTEVGAMDPMPGTHVSGTSLTRQ